MKKQISLLTLNIALLIMLASNHIYTAAELPAINAEATNKLWTAAGDGDLDAAQQALAQGADINMYAENGNRNAHALNLPASTALYTAGYNGHHTVVKFLLQQGASANATIHGDTPLLHICATPNLPQTTACAIAMELLKYKANVNAQTLTYKETPLMHSICHTKNKNMARLLILAGADITIKTNTNRTAFDMIGTPAMREACLEACAINEQAFQQLHELEIEIRTEMLKNLHTPIENLVSASNDSVPFYTNRGEEQPAYDLLNARIAEQWTPILQKLETERALNQPDCLPVASVAAIAIDYLFSPQ